MALITVHIDDCQRILNKSMEEVHIFLDQYAKTFDVSVYGEYHRTFLHNMYGIKIAQAKWGEAGRKSALIHIVRDYTEMSIPDWDFVEKYIGKALLYFNDATNFYLGLDPDVIRAWWPESLCCIAFK